MKFKSKSFHEIQKQIFSWNSKINLFIKFKDKSFHKIQNNILIKFKITFYKTALHIAVEKENVEIVQLLLSHDKIDINIQYISYNKIYEILNKFFHSIQTQIFSLHSNPNLFITFKNESFHIIQKQIFS